MSTRDDFTEKTKLIMAQRVAYRCSYKGCRIATIGPKYGNPQGTSNIGIACHICAAAPGGPRYDASMTKEERASIENGIWMCQTHSNLIDKDVVKYPADLLHQWKKEAEEEAENNLANYRITDTELKNTNTLNTLLERLIEEGNYDLIRSLIDDTQVAGIDNELLLRYEIIYNVYCNRASVELSVQNYLDHVEIKQADEILKVLLSHNVIAGISLILPYCNNQELMSWAKKLIEGSAEKYFFRSKEEIEEGEDLNFQDTTTLTKLLSTIIIKNQFPAIPIMANGEKFSLYNKEFLFTILGHSLELHQSLINNDELNHDPSNVAYKEIKKSISKIIQLDKELQLLIWIPFLNYIIRNKKEFDEVYERCPVYIKDDEKCKGIKVSYTITHTPEKKMELLDDEEILADWNSTLSILYSLNKEQRLDFLEDHKYLFRKTSAFLYLWTISSSEEDKQKYEILLKYKELYIDDFLWNCMGAFYVNSDNSDELNWILNHKQNMALTSVELYIKVLEKYHQWEDLRNLSTIIIPFDIKYQIACVLFNDKSVDGTNFCIKLFNELAESGRFLKGMFYNQALLYDRLHDVVKAREYIEKEYDNNPEDRWLCVLLQFRYRSNIYIKDKYFESALKSTDSDVLFFASLYFEKVVDKLSFFKYLLRSYLINHENENAIHRLGILFLEGEKDSFDIGKVYCLTNSTESKMIALIENAYIDGIQLSKIDDCFIIDKNSMEAIQFDFVAVGETVEYHSNKYVVSEIKTLYGYLSQTVVSKFLTSSKVTQIGGSSQEDAVQKISQMLQEREDETNRIFGIYNESKGVMPVSLLARYLGTDYFSIWSTLIRENELKINNYSKLSSTVDGYIFAQDAVYTLGLLNALNDTEVSNCLISNYVKNNISAKIKEQIEDLRNGCIKGTLFSKNKQLYRTENTVEKKKNTVEFLVGLKNYIDKVTGKDSSIFISKNEDFKRFFIENDFPDESYTLGLAQANSTYAIITDDPFLCILCDMEGISHLSVVDFIFAQNLSCEQILDYLYELRNYKFLNYFNADIFKRIIDEIKGMDDSLQEKNFARIRNWLAPEEFDDTHAKRVFNVYRDLVLENQSSFYVNALGDIGRFYYMKLFPEGYKKIVEEIKNEFFHMEIIVEDERADLPVSDD